MQRYSSDGTPGAALARVRVLAAALALAAVGGGCAAGADEKEPLAWSPQWFQCDGRFECVAVYDAFCKYTAVNSTYSLQYQDWARQQVRAVGELRPCELPGEQRPLAAYCRSKRCEYP